MIPNLKSGIALDDNAVFVTTLYSLHWSEGLGETDICVAGSLHTDGDRGGEKYTRYVELFALLVPSLHQVQ